MSISIWKISKNIWLLLLHIHLCIVILPGDRGVWNFKPHKRVDKIQMTLIKLSWFPLSNAFAILLYQDFPDISAVRFTLNFDCKYLSLTASCIIVVYYCVNLPGSPSFFSHTPLLPSWHASYVLAWFDMHSY